MLVKIISKHELSLDKKLEILNKLYINEDSVISIHLNKRPDEYFQYLRLEIPKEFNLVGKLYIQELEFEPKSLIKELERVYPEYNFNILDNPFEEYKALEEIVYRIVSKLNTPDIPYKLYTSKSLSDSTIKYISEYIELMEDSNKYVIEQKENPAYDPMYICKKSYIILRRK